MPLPHVEYLLEVYAKYLDKRMLESGRLSKGMVVRSFFLLKLSNRRYISRFSQPAKGTFNEIAADMNAEFKVSYYERDQVR